MQKYGLWFLIRRTLKLMAYYKVVRFDHTTISYKGMKLDVEVADTRAKTQLGLSFRRSLPGGHGMVLVYETLAPHIIWMLNMKMSIDIIWLNDKGKIVYIVNGAPAGRSVSDFMIYQPKQKSKYVLELPAGTTKTLKIKPYGDMDITALTAGHEPKEKA